MVSESIVYIVDDDPPVRASLKRLVEEVGLRCHTYSTAAEFLDDYHPENPGCLVLDVRLPDMSGIALQRRLASESITIPIILISGHGDVPMAADALRNGALDFMEKPVNPQRLLDRIQEALAKDAEARRAAAKRETIESRVNRLTARERQVVDLAVTGLTNKQIAGQLGVSPQAIDAQRSKAMKKLEVDTVADLVRLMLEVSDT